MNLPLGFIIPHIFHGFASKSVFAPQAASLQNLRFSNLSLKEMATVPGQLIWEILKKNNSFLVKEFGNGTAGVKFSKEPNNLYNLHSYKHSDLISQLNYGKSLRCGLVQNDQLLLLAFVVTCQLIVVKYRELKIGRCRLALEKQGKSG
ncbi:hypothetical protein ACS0TY_015646 [Phlomoides rotata]